MAAQSGLSVEGIRVLVQGGAHLDFRSRDGLTAVHKAVRVHNHTGLLVRTLKQSYMHAQVERVINGIIIITICRV